MRKFLASLVVGIPVALLVAGFLFLNLNAWWWNQGDQWQQCAVGVDIGLGILPTIFLIVMAVQWAMDELDW